MGLTDEEVVKYIRENFVYNADGTFERKDRRNSTGSYDKDGYLIIKIKKRQYKAHRLVYAYFNGRFPEGEIDHINRKRSDNRIENLRVATRIENVHNETRNPNKDTGVIGIYVDKCTKKLKKKYTFRINGKTYRYPTLEAAIEARKELKGEM